MSGASIQENYRQTTEMVRPCEENERGAHSEKNARCGHTGERRRGRPNLRWNDSCKRDMTEVGLKDDKITNRAAWRNTIIIYTGGNCIPATPHDRTSQGRRRSVFIYRCNRN